MLHYWALAASIFVCAAVSSAQDHRIIHEIPERIQVASDGSRVLVVHSIHPVKLSDVLQELPLTVPVETVLPDGSRFEGVEITNDGSRAGMCWRRELARSGGGQRAATEENAGRRVGLVCATRRARSADEARTVTKTLRSSSCAQQFVVN